MLKNVFKSFRFYQVVFFCRCCKVCSFKAKSSKRLKDHVKDAHKNLTSYQCDLCSSSGTFDKAEIELHMKAHVMKEPQNFYCEFCSKEFDKVNMNCE